MTRIMTLNPRRYWAWVPSLTALIVAICMPICMLAIDATAVAAPRWHARSSRAIAVATRTIPRPSIRAARLNTKTDRSLVSDAKQLKRCLRSDSAHPKRCNAARRALQLAGSRQAQVITYPSASGSTKASEEIKGFEEVKAPEISVTDPATAPSAPTEAPSPPSPSSMWISLNAGGWGNEQYADVAGAVNTVRTEETNISGWTKVGVKVIYDDSGPYNSGGVKALNVSSWVANAVAYVKANPQVAAVEVLNEASGSWFWGENADSTENAAAYAKLLEAVHTAFVKEFGSARPLILASYGGPSEAPVWGERIWAANPNVGDYCDGVVVHPYPSSGRGEAQRKQVEEAHAKTGKPVYITEVGWNTAVVTEAEQAQDITNFIDWAKSTGYVADVDIFGWRDYGPSVPNEDWGIETFEGRHKLAYSALAAFPH
jgi:hypothetical protein